MKSFISSLLLLVVFTSDSFAQYESDVESVDSIIKALYEVISGDAGVERDWDRFRNLFIEEGKLTPTFQNQEGRVGYVQWGIEEYIERVDQSFLENGFHEDEIGRRVETYRYVTHVFSTYQSKRTIDGEIIARGINSIQLFNDGERWRVVSVFWSSENDEFPIPEEYLDN
ncbi:MAG: hypothetical protein ED557_06350 [Balneola sp.]|nr:MAG: hypothetical protein ED557_06350 [Balneola sp.]